MTTHHELHERLAVVSKNLGQHWAYCDSSTESLEISVELNKQYDAIIEEIKQLIANEN